jgi:hypothetical protein
MPSFLLDKNVVSHDTWPSAREFSKSHYIFYPSFHCDNSTHRMNGHIDIFANSVSPYKINCSSSNRGRADVLDCDAMWVWSNHRRGLVLMRRYKVKSVQVNKVLYESQIYALPLLDPSTPTTRPEFPS